MDLLVIAARLFLALIFLIAALTKLVDRAGTRRAVQEFGVPRPFAAAVAILVPLAELGAAGALVVPGMHVWGALGTLGLLTVFTVAIVVNLALGLTPDCHCFGELFSERAGWRTVVRNVVFAGLALLVLWDAAGRDVGGALAWLDGMPLEPVALVITGGTLVVVAILGWLVVLLWQQQGRLLRRIDALERARRLPIHGASQGLPVGSDAPSFTLQAADGRRVSLDDLVSQSRPFLLLFSDPDCGACAALSPSVERWTRQHGDRLGITVVTRRRHNGASMDREIIAPVVLFQERREVAERYGALGTPSAVLIGADGKIASPLAAGASAISELVSHAAANGD